jgi:hypothetical protein
MLLNKVPTSVCLSLPCRFAHFWITFLGHIYPQDVKIAVDVRIFWYRESTDIIFLEVIIKLYPENSVWWTEENNGKCLVPESHLTFHNDNEFLHQLNFYPQSAIDCINRILCCRYIDMALSSKMMTAACKTPRRHNSEDPNLNIYSWDYFCCKIIIIIIIIIIIFIIVVVISILVASYEVEVSQVFPNQQCTMSHSQSLASLLLLGWVLTFCCVGEIVWADSLMNGRSGVWGT